MAKVTISASEIPDVGSGNEIQSSLSAFKFPAPKEKMGKRPKTARVRGNMSTSPPVSQSQSLPDEDSPLKIKDSGVNSYEDSPLKIKDSGVNSSTEDHRLGKHILGDSLEKLYDPHKRSASKDGHKEDVHRLIESKDGFKDDGRRKYGDGEQDDSRKHRHKHKRKYRREHGEKHRRKEKEEYSPTVVETPSPRKDHPEAGIDAAKSSPCDNPTKLKSQASQNSKTSHFQLPKPITYIWPLFSKRRVSPSFTPIRIVVVGGSHAGLQVALRLHKYLVDFPGMSIILIEKRSHFQNNLANPLAMVDMDVASKSWISYEHAFTGNNGARFVQDTVTRLTRTEVTTSRSGSFEYDYLVVATGCTPVTPIRIESLEKPDGLSEMQTYFNTILGAKRILVVGGGAVGCEIAGYIKSRYPSKEVTLVHSHQDLIPLQYKTKFKESVLRALQDLGVNCILNDLINTEVFEGKTFSVKTCTLRTVRGGIRVESDLQILATGTGRPCSDFMLSLCDGDRKSLKNGLVDHSGRIIVKTTLQLAWGSGNIFALGDVAKTGGSQNGISLMTQVTVVVENLKQLMEEKISGAPPKLTRYNPDVSNGTIAIWIGDEGICCIANTLVLGTWATRIIKDKHALIDTYTKALRAT